MGLEGKFVRKPSVKALGIQIYSFSLKNTNFFQTEVVNLLLSDASMSRHRVFRGLEIAAGETIVIDVDSVGWDWCQDDFCASIDSAGNIIKKWAFHLAGYNQGGCPECGGSKRCRKCNGQGYPMDYVNFRVQACRYCGGTGICMTCYTPQRQSAYAGQSTGTLSDRSRSDIQNRIIELQAKLDRVEWDMRRMELDGTSVSSPSVYSSYSQLRYAYATQIIALQSKLK